MTAERQASLLRGINVGGHNRVAMTDLRALYEGLGCTDVETYVQSGNVIFCSPRGPDHIGPAVEAAIRSPLGLEIRVLGRTHEDLERVVATDAFAGADPAWRHVVFLSQALSLDAADTLRVAASGREKVVVAGHEIHLLLPDGIGRTKLSQGLIERRLQVIATARNWRTVNRLRDLTGVDDRARIRL
jgi:uncharacterized protein (DUF1697 family)